MDGRNDFIMEEKQDGMDGSSGISETEGMAGECSPEEVKAARKHFSGLGGMYILGTIVIYVSQLIPISLIKILKPEWMEDGNISLIVSILPMYLIGMPVLIRLVRRIPEQTPQRHSIKPGSFILAVIMCYAIVYVSNIVGTVITTVIGMLKGGVVQNQVLDVTQSVSMWMIFLYMVICAPILEEYVFRKLIVDRTVRYGQGTAVLFSGLMFGLFHGNLNQFVYAFVLGMFLAFLYVKTGNIKVTIALHMMINFMGGLVSSGLMRLIDLDAYMEAALSGDMTALTAFLQENAVGIIAYGAYILFVVGMMIAGSVLLIVSLARRKFVLARGSVAIPRGQRFRTMIGNPGMIAYCVFWIVMIILQLCL